MERIEWCLPDSRAALSLDLRTCERELGPLITAKDEHAIGCKDFPGTSWQEGSSNWGTKKEETGRDRDGWTNSACLLRAHTLDYVFPPRKVCGLNSWKAFACTVEFSSDLAEMSSLLMRDGKNWNLRLPLWAPVPVVTLSSSGAPASYLMLSVFPLLQV